MGFAGEPSHEHFDAWANSLTAVRSQLPPDDFLPDGGK